MSDEVSRRTIEDEWDQMRARIAALEATVAETKMMLEATAIACGQHADALRVAEATVARLMALFGPEDVAVVHEKNGQWGECADYDYAADLFAALLARRMKG